MILISCAGGRMKLSTKNCVASATAGENFRFKSPYKMADHGSSENGINWADGHIEYKDLHCGY